jgi:hypothetical protein
LPPRHEPQSPCERSSLSSKESYVFAPARIGGAYGRHWRNVAPSSFPHRAPGCRRAGARVTAALAAAFAVPMSAQAAQPGVSQISADPYTVATAPSGEHATEVEPDTFAYGSTIVSAFQTGRVFNGGATDIGWATSTDGGVSWTHGFLPGTSKEAAQPGPFFSVSDASVAYDARDGVWLISWLGAHFSGGGIVDVMVSRSTDGGLSNRALRLSCHPPARLACPPAASADFPPGS